MHNFSLKLALLRLFTTRSQFYAPKPNVTAISALAPYLDEKLKPLVLKVTLNIVPKIRSERARARALLSLAPHLPDTLHSIAFVIATEIQQEEFRGPALSSLAPYVSDEIKSQILSNVCEMRSEYQQIYTLAAILQYIPDNLKSQILRDAFHTAYNNLHEPVRSRILGILASHFDADTRKKIYQEAIFNTDQLKELVADWKNLNYDGLEDKMISFLRFTAQKNRVEGFRAIRVMIEPLTTFAGRDIAPELYRAITDVTRWWP